jgi:hypothetical protein
MTDADTGCTLDQWLTSAMAAMAFAVSSWAEFCDHAQGITGQPVPIDRMTMLHHAAHLGDMIDPDRMPGG